MNMEELKKTYEKFGAIYPILVDKDGKPIDGFHRKQIDPNWPTMKVDTDDDVKKLMIALVANVQRREVNGTEITKRLDAIAELTGFKPSKIAEELGMKYDWVISHISDKFKDKPMQAIAGFRPTIKESDTDFSPAIELNQPESTMTEEEKPNLEMVKILISVPGNIYNRLEIDAKKSGVETRVFIARIILKWAKGRGELWNKK